MVRKKDRKKLFTALVALVALLLLIAGIAVVKSLSTDQSGKTTSSETKKKDEPKTPVGGDNTTKPDPAVTVPEDTTDKAAIDPTLVATIDIEPMSLVVSYMKGIGGVEFQVQRTPSGTKYVQFSSPKLAGTKCTNDNGPFASIIESPAADESATLTKTTKVDGTTYGLSLADASCTNEPELLKQFQNAFSEPFSLLKKL